jgi:hypothetical protein
VAPLAELMAAGEEPRYAPLLAGEHLEAQTIRTFRYLRDALAEGRIELPPSAREESPFGREKKLGLV